MTPEILAADPEWPYSKAKTAVLLAAAAVIREDGPRSATLKNIANRAGITEPAIFRHFDGVDGLFAGLFHAYERVYQRFDEVYDSEERGLSRFRTAILSIVDYLAAAKDFSYILIHAKQVFRGYPDLRRRITEYAKKDQDNAMACIAQGIERGEIRGDVDPLSLASMVIGTIHSTVTMWIETGFAFDLREVCHHRWDDMERLMAHNPSLAKHPAKAKSRHENALSLLAAKVAVNVGALGGAKTGAKASSKPAQAAKKSASKGSANTASKPTAKSGGKVLSKPGKAVAKAKPVDKRKAAAPVLKKKAKPVLSGKAVVAKEAKRIAPKSTKAVKKTPASSKRK